jgi:hypothetical protein
MKKVNLLFSRLVNGIGVMALFLLTLGLFAFAQNPTTEENINDGVVSITLHYDSGETAVYESLASELSKFNKLEGVFACTAEFQGGGCSQTANTCDEAVAAFKACACSEGHTALCAQQ